MTHKQNCSDCKHARSDRGIFSGERIHCEIYNNVPWYYQQHVTSEQDDLIKSVGCASWQSNQ